MLKKVMILSVRRYPYLLVNAVNSIETFTDDEFDVPDEDHGIVELILEGSVSDETTLLLDSMILGLERYSGHNTVMNYIRLQIEEV